jgi:hypothetical protein
MVVYGVQSGIIFSATLDSAPTEKGGATMSSEPIMYIVRWTGVLGISGEKIFFSVGQVNAFIRRMRNAIKGYTVEEVYK